jgi:hypothetical protein
MECPYTSGTAVIVWFTRKGICVNGHSSLKVKEMIVEGKGFIFYGDERQPARITRIGRRSSIPSMRNSGAKYLKL